MPASTAWRTISQIEMVYCVFTATVYPHDLDRQRAVHLDHYTGQPLLGMSYADYGPLEH